MRSTCPGGALCGASSHAAMSGACGEVRAQRQKVCKENGICDPHGDCRAVAGQKAPRGLRSRRAERSAFVPSVRAGSVNAVREVGLVSSVSTASVPQNNVGARSSLPSKACSLGGGVAVGGGLPAAKEPFDPTRPECCPSQTAWPACLPRPPRPPGGSPPPAVTSLAQGALDSDRGAVFSGVESPSSEGSAASSSRWRSRCSSFTGLETSASSSVGSGGRCRANSLTVRYGHLVVHGVRVSQLHAVKNALQDMPATGPPIAAVASQTSKVLEVVSEHAGRHIDGLRDAARVLKNAGTPQAIELSKTVAALNVVYKSLRHSTLQKFDGLHDRVDSCLRDRVASRAPGTITQASATDERRTKATKMHPSSEHVKKFSHVPSLNSICAAAASSERTGSCSGVAVVSAAPLQKRNRPGQRQRRKWREAMVGAVTPPVCSLNESPRASWADSCPLDACVRAVDFANTAKASAETSTSLALSDAVVPCAPAEVTTCESVASQTFSPTFEPSAISFSAGVQSCATDATDEHASHVYCSLPSTAKVGFVGVQTSRPLRASRGVSACPFTRNRKLQCSLPDPSVQSQFADFERQLTARLERHFENELAEASKQWIANANKLTAAFDEVVAERDRLRELVSQHQKASKLGTSEKIFTCSELQPLLHD